MSNRASLLVSALIAPFLLASPALAAPGESAGWVQQQPTRTINTDMAQVLPRDLGYIDAGGSFGGGYLMGYERGMGNGGELNLGLSALFNSAPSAINANVFGSWKQQLVRGGAMAVAVIPEAFVSNIGGIAGVGVGVGLPLTFDAGAGHFTAEPKVVLPSLNLGTSGGNVAVNLAYIAPVSPRFSLLLDADPTFGFGGGFNLPLGVGARFSPSATNHVDFTFGTLNTNPGTNVQIGLVSILGHVGF